MFVLWVRFPTARDEADVTPTIWADRFTAFVREIVRLTDLQRFLLSRVPLLRGFTLSSPRVICGGRWTIASRSGVVMKELCVCADIRLKPHFCGFALAISECFEKIAKDLWPWEVKLVVIHLPHEHE